MKWMLILGTVTIALGPTAWPGHAFSQEGKQRSEDGAIEREKLYLAGWDPDEPVPAYVYYKKGNRSMPVVIFLHGMGGSKEHDGDRMRHWAAKGLFVVALDAHLHGE